jgi:hypothetical protein
MHSFDPPVSEHHRRLLQGMAQSVAVKGYADTTISTPAPTA